jgi:hypothetical protein
MITSNTTPAIYIYLCRVGDTDDKTERVLCEHCLNVYDDNGVLLDREPIRESDDYCEGGEDDCLHPDPDGKQP